MSEPSAAEMASAFKTAIYELTVNKVKEYWVGGRKCTYFDLADLTKSYLTWNAIAQAEADGGSMATLTVLVGADQ
jgi:hypothetical protein